MHCGAKKEVRLNVVLYYALEVETTGEYIMEYKKCGCTVRGDVHTDASPTDSFGCNFRSNES